MKPTILVCGEALVDVFAGGDTPTGVSLDARVGGSPFNVAIGLARMGRSAGLLGAVSTDFLGERLLRALTEEGVDTSCVTRTAASTTLGLVGIDTAGVPAYAFYGHQGADRQLLPDALERLPVDVAAVHLGSFSSVVEPIATTLRGLVERKRNRSLISFDPNVRLQVEADLGRWREMLDWMLPRTHLLKVSAEDLELLQPGCLPDAFCAQALHRGVRLVVVTRGDGGVMARTATAAVEVPAFVVPVVDTVGAGDTLQAALLTWLQENEALNADALSAMPADRLRACLSFAAQAAAITCSRRGADLPRRSELPA